MKLFWLKQKRPENRDIRLMRVSRFLEQNGFKITRAASGVLIVTDSHQVLDAATKGDARLQEWFTFTPVGKR